MRSSDTISAVVIAAPEFTDCSAVVVDGSDLFRDMIDERCRHARSLLAMCSGKATTEIKATESRLNASSAPAKK